MKTKKIQPIHPGEILLHDFMEPLGLSQSALANAIGVTPMRVSQIVRGQRDLEIRIARTGKPCKLRPLAQPLAA